MVYLSCLNIISIEKQDSHQIRKISIQRKRYITWFLETLQYRFTFFLWPTFSYNNVHPLSNHKGSFCIIVGASYLTDTLTRLKSIFVNYRRHYDINKLILKWTKIQLVVKTELENNCLNCNKAEHWSSNDILYHSNVNLYCSV
jgi:hypothetical protein